MDPAERMRKMPARIVEEFLTGDKLRRMFSHLCNNASGQVRTRATCFSRVE